MKKAMLSQPMNGIAEKDIVETRNRAIRKGIAELKKYNAESGNRGVD
jgi:hypothetical protein